MISRTQIGRNAIYAMPSADRHRLFVITRGEEAVHAGEIDQPPMFWVIDTAAPRRRRRSAYAIGSPFDRIAVVAGQHDRDRVLLGGRPRRRRASSATRTSSRSIDLDAARRATTNPTLDTIRSFGSVPEGISLSPPMVVPGAADPTPRTFAFILSANNLTVLDADAPRSPRDLDPPRPRRPAGDAARGRVRAEHRERVRAQRQRARRAPGLARPRHARRTPTDNDFRPQLAELGAGGGPTDIAVYDDPSGKRYLLAATPNTGEVVVIDADTAQFRSIPVADPIDRILLFPQRRRHAAAQGAVRVDRRER